jgi:hypothetical protein
VVVIPASANGVLGREKRDSGRIGKPEVILKASQTDSRSAQFPPPTQTFWNVRRERPKPRVVWTQFAVFSNTSLLHVILFLELA